jgi:hypothetical protein
VSLNHAPGLDVLPSSTKFPVVESAPLEPVPSRFLRAARRSPRDLPDHPGDSVLVFRSNERFALAPDGPKMLASDVVVKASMVAVVVTRAQEVPMVAVLPSVTRGTRMLLRASYLCQVLDPIRVLEHGCWDVTIDLRHYLLRDAKTRMLGARRDAHNNPEVSQRILARTFARNELEPPMIPGMRVELVNVALSITDDGQWVPGPRGPVDDDNEYDTSGRRDGYPADESGRRPRDGYGD